MNKKEWLGTFKRGDVWRSIEVGTCGICGCRSNKWEMAGYPAVRPKLLCPGKRKYHDLHEEIANNKVQIAYNGKFGRVYLPRSVIAELVPRSKRT
jgi:hypothetical protein